MALWFVFFVALKCLVAVALASVGDLDPHYRHCIDHCEQNGCVGSTCFKSCGFLFDGLATDDSWYHQEPLYMQWKQWDCRSNCRYQCMQDQEKERQKNGHKPVKYHGKWPFKIVFGIQEPVSVALCVLNLALLFHGWLLYFVLLYYKLPLRPENGKTYYQHGYIWHMYSLLAMNSSFWSAFSDSRDFDSVKKLDYLSAMVLFGYSLILAIVASFSRQNTSCKAMVAAPLVVLSTSHVVYINLCESDHELKARLVVIVTVVLLFTWVIMAGTVSHPSSGKLWSLFAASVFAISLEILDFPPYLGYIDAHALWHALCIPSTYLWWSFLRDDAVYSTVTLLEKEM